MSTLHPQGHQHDPGGHHCGSDGALALTPWAPISLSGFLPSVPQEPWPRQEELAAPAGVPSSRRISGPLSAFLTRHCQARVASYSRGTWPAAPEPDPCLLPLCKENAKRPSQKDPEARCHQVTANTGSTEQVAGTCDLGGCLYLHPRAALSHLQDFSHHCPGTKSSWGQR